MKNYSLHFFLIIFLSVNFFINAQDSNTVSEEKLENIMDYNAFYDYTEQHLSSIDTIPGFESKRDKLKVYGTIFKSDGVTPAKDIILYIEQADENGDFDVRKENDVKYIHNRGWIKTDSNGKYAFYTYVPGNDRRYNQLKQLFPIIKEPSKTEYEIASFLFDEDPLLSKYCRKKMAKKGDVTRILKLKNEDGLLTAKKDIILQEDRVVMTK